MSYGYDSLDRTTTLTDSDSLATDLEFGYDARSQLQAEQQVTGLVGTSVRLDRDYAVSHDTASLGSALGVNTVGPKSAHFEFNATLPADRVVPWFLSRCYDGLVGCLTDVANAWA